MPIELDFECSSYSDTITVTMANPAGSNIWSVTYDYIYNDGTVTQQRIESYNTDQNITETFSSGFYIGPPTNYAYLTKITVTPSAFSNFTLSYFNVSSNNSNSKFTGITWSGSPNVSSLYQAFKNAVYLDYVEIRTEVTNSLTNMEECFYNCRSLEGINTTNAINFSNVTNMSRMFNLAINFNQNVNGWDVRNVVSFENMFNGATVFNNGNETSLNWTLATDTNKNIHMGGMFQNCNFNKPFGNGWNTSRVYTMYQMFRDNASFNQNIGNWNLSGATEMTRIFYNATAFNNGEQALTTNTKPLTWTINQGRITNMTEAFRGAKSFSQDLSWNIAPLTGGSAGILLDNIFHEYNTSMTSTLFNRILNRWANQSPGSTNGTFMTIKYGPSLQATADVATLRGRSWNINETTGTSGLVSYNPTSPYWERRFTLTYSVVSSPPIAAHVYKLYNVGDTVNSISTYTAQTDDQSYVFPTVMLYGQTDYTTLMIIDTTNNNIVDTVYLNPRIACFKVGTKILTDRGYVPIEDLRKGDMVKTAVDVYKPIYMIGRKEIYNHALPERIDNQLYVCTPQNYPDVFEDLVITGCHSILENDFASPEQKEKTLLVNKKIFVTTIDCGTYKFGKCRIPACVDERANIYEKDGPVMVYHMALENDDMCGNYGVYANGLLVETCSKRYLDELSYMHIVN
jgi:hypothetical protein